MAWVLHVDLDQFIAAVEVLRRPELRGRPVVVGGDGDPTKRGVVSTASYEARAHGVHSGLPLRTAARRSPDAVFLPVDREVYESASADVMATLREFDAVVEVLGWDEAFLGVQTDDPEALARRIQERIRAVTHLDCTVGIGRKSAGDGRRRQPDARSPGPGRRAARGGRTIHGRSPRRSRCRTCERGRSGWCARSSPRDLAGVGVHDDDAGRDGHQRFPAAVGGRPRRRAAVCRTGAGRHVS